MADDYENDLPEHEAGETASQEDLEKAAKYLALCKEREKMFENGWWKRAQESERLYSQPSGHEGERYKSVYNILYSNTEVLVPSLYSATAKPDVRVRFKDAQLKPIPEVIERFLTLYTDSAAVGTESFDDAVKDAVLSALTAASGCLRLRYYAEAEFPLQTESVGYKNLLWGYAKKWARVPWIAFKHELSKSEFQKQFKIKDADMEAGYSSVTTEVNADSASNKRADCVVYEFWHKESKTVWFVSEDWREKFLQKTDDPFGLRGFYPTPGLLMLTLKPGQLEPIPLYYYYQNQAEELNRVTVRLNKVLSAIKVRGAYSSLLGDDMQKILADTETENALVAAGESIMLQQGGGFDKAIWLLPLEKLVQVAENLYRAREAIKQVIYELTGISDIIRGSNVASETATATQTKDKWGTLRLRKMQTVVANYIRDLFRIAVDAGTTQVSPEMWKKLTQLPIPTQQEQALAKQQLQFLQAQQQEMAQMQQAGGPPLPPPKSPDPKLVAEAQGPTIEQIVERISSDVDRTFTINIQTSSTIDIDTAQDKTEVSEFMNALGQMLAGLQPLMGLGPKGLETIKALLVAVCQRYKFGLPVVDIIEQLEPPPPPPPDPKIQAEMAGMKMEQEARQQEIQAETAKRTQEAQISQAELQGKLQLMEAELNIKKQELALKEQELQMKARELQMKDQAAQAQHQRQMLTLAATPATVPASKPKAQNAPVRR